MFHVPTGSDRYRSVFDQITHGDRRMSSSLKMPTKHSQVLKKIAEIRAAPSETPDLVLRLGVVFDAGNQLLHVVTNDTWLRHVGHPSSEKKTPEKINGKYLCLVHSSPLTLSSSRIEHVLIFVALEIQVSRNLRRAPPGGVELEFWLGTSNSQISFAVWVNQGHQDATCFCKHCEHFLNGMRAKII